MGFRASAQPTQVLGLVELTDLRSGLWMVTDLSSRDFAKPATTEQVFSQVFSQAKVTSAKLLLTANRGLAVRGAIAPASRLVFKDWASNDMIARLNVFPWQCGV